MYLFNYLNKRYSEVYYLGDKTYSDILDKKKTRPYLSISFYVNSSKEEIHNRFIDSEIYDDYVKVQWGKSNYNIYYDKYILKNKYQCSCFCVLEDKNGYIDFDYNLNNLDISSINDINNHLIRLIDYNVLKTNPDLILKIFELKAINNFTIEPYTLSKMIEYKNNITDFADFYNIFKHPFVVQTMEFINYINFFNNTKFKGLFDKLYAYKNIINKAQQYHLSFMEQYFIIFQDNLYDNYIYKTYLNDYDKYCVRWCDINYNILTNNKTQLRLNIYNSIDETINRVGIQLLRNCLFRLNNIHILQRQPSVDKDILSYCLNGRPYFKEQLHITNEEIIDIFKTLDVDNIKTKIIKYILKLEHYPNTLIEEVKQNYKSILQEE